VEKIKKTEFNFYSKNKLQYYPFSSYFMPHYTLLVKTDKITSATTNQYGNNYTQPLLAIKKHTTD